MINIYRYHEDAGHGWLEVRKEELKRLGIQYDISDFSYQRGDMVFLEEDRDANLFFKAKKNNYEDFDYVVVNNGDESPIRQYERYECE